MLSGLDYYYLMQELQVLKKARLTKIFQDDEQREVFLFDFHVPGKGSKWLQMIVPETMFLTEQKMTPATPPGYCQFLRKKIQGMIVQNIQQVNFERIILMELGTREEVHFKLYIEMFSKGNMILTDPKEKIIGTWKTKEYGSRSVRGGTEYLLPPELVNTPKITLKELGALWKENNKDLVVFCAKSLGLGGYYSELLIKEIKLDKKLKKLTEAQIKKLHAGIKKIFKKEINPKIEEEPHPIDGKKEYENFSQALKEFYGGKIFKEKAENNVKERITKAQKEKIKEFEKAAEENQKIGELIYNHYVEFQQVLKEAKEGNYEHCEKIDHKKIKVKIKNGK